MLARSLAAGAALGRRSHIVLVRRVRAGRASGAASAGCVVEALGGPPAGCLLPDSVHAIQRACGLSESEPWFYGQMLAKCPPLHASSMLLVHLLPLGWRRCAVCLTQAGRIIHYARICPRAATLPCSHGFWRICVAVCCGSLGTLARPRRNVTVANSYG